MTHPRGHRSRSQPRLQLLGVWVVAQRALLILLQIPVLSLPLALALVLVTDSPPEPMFLSVPLPGWEREGNPNPVPDQIRLSRGERMLREPGMLKEQGMDLMARSRLPSLPAMAWLLSEGRQVPSAELVLLSEMGRATGPEEQMQMGDLRTVDWC